MALTIRVMLDLLVISFMFSFVVLQQKSSAQSLRLMKCGFDKIYQLGDSLADTGNCIRENLCARRLRCGRFPYGMNFSQKKSTGRCSNGMLIIDFIVAGATALPAEVMAEKKIVNAATNSSLSVQLAWMSSHFKTSTRDRAAKLKKALFLVGEVGGNDFNHGLLQGKTIKELRNMAPEVVQTIIRGVRRVIGFGATQIVVPGNFPIGCLPIYLTKFRTDNSTAYDNHHCLKDLNNFAVFYNHHLQQAIQELKKRYPKITLIYGDYYNAYMWLLRNAVALGFDKSSLQKACCGIGRGYNFDLRKICGSPRVPICTDPNAYISWDGIHLTQEAYKWLARWLINDMLPKLNCQ
ncbi:GDSL esterase/lipase At5g03980-like isoform X2 [Nicotiana tomentosiformis]|uniref:GDSL esterase/lipase At5g03980-like isoform X2 n=1 Tax=Nicotiana tomentosiformis TaxID=4098 RepID=UPI00051C0B46|nr:GDSL esterase/lipase At5g03980-like [Nicotiana tomentosiformis]